MADWTQPPKPLRENAPPDEPMPVEPQGEVEPLAQPARAQGEVEPLRKWSNVHEYAEARRAFTEGRGPDPGAYRGTPRQTRPKQEFQQPADPFAGGRDDARHNEPAVDVSNPFAAGRDDARHNEPDTAAKEGKLAELLHRLIDITEQQQNNKVAELLQQLINVTERGQDEDVSRTINEAKEAIVAALAEVRAAIGNLDRGLG